LGKYTWSYRLKTPSHWFWMNNVCSVHYFKTWTHDLCVTKTWNSRSALGLSSARHALQFSVSLPGCEEFIAS
jgi:hypothetical protein